MIKKYRYILFFLYFACIIDHCEKNFYSLKNISSNKTKIYRQKYNYK